MQYRLIVLLALFFGLRYKWDKNEKHLKPETGLLQLREGLKVFANLRPATVLPQVKCVLQVTGVSKFWIWWFICLTWTLSPIASTRREQLKLDLIMWFSLYSMSRQRKAGGWFTLPLVLSLSDIYPFAVGRKSFWLEKVNEIFRKNFKVVILTGFPWVANAGCWTLNK